MCCLFLCTAYIKLGQALSIRPDLLSPAAMNEMQKLCDKVCPHCLEDLGMFCSRDQIATRRRERVSQGRICVGKRPPQQRRSCAARQRVV